jgi:cytochrome b
LPGHNVGSISHEKAMTESATPSRHGNPQNRIWDLPTRLFHWLLAICIVALVVTAKMGQCHELASDAGTGGAGLAGLSHSLGLGRRVLVALWQLHPFRAAMSDMRGKSTTQDRAGHNPLGSLSVIAMLPC